MKEQKDIYKKDIKMILDYGRYHSKKDGGSYSKEVIIQGLGRLKDWNKIESGDIPVEKFVFDRILHRLGMRTDTVEIMITGEDWSYYCHRIQIYEDYYEENFEKMEEEIVRYKEITKNESIIHSQFAEVMYAKMKIIRKSDWKQSLQILEGAIKLTAEGWEHISPAEICLAPEELEIIILMAKCYRKQRLFRKALRLLKWVEEYSKTHIIDREVRCRFMPLFYLELSKLKSAAESLNDIRAGIQLLYQTGSLFYIIPLQNQYLFLLDELERQGITGKTYRRSRRRVEEERKVLLELCEEVGVDWRRLEPIQRYKNAYLISEILYRYRTYLRQSRRIFCEGVCSEVAYNKIEKGVSVPRKTFQQLMNRIRYPATNVITVLHGATKEYIDKAIKVMYLIRCYRYEEADQIFTQLLLTFQRKRLIENCPRNKQFFMGRKAVLDYALGRISIETEREQLILALKQTIPEYPDMDISKKPLLWQETVLLNNIANTYIECEDYKKAASIWESIRKSYQASEMYGVTETEGYDMIQSNYASCIGSSGDYKRSNELCYENINHFLKKAEMEDLGHSCYGIAWNKEEEMKKEYGKIKKENACQKKLRQAEVLAKAANNTFVVEFLKEHRERIYGKK